MFVRAVGFGDGAPPPAGASTAAGPNEAAALQKLALRQLVRVRRALRCWNLKHRGESSSFSFGSTPFPPDSRDYWQIAQHYKLYENESVDGLPDAENFPDKTPDEQITGQQPNDPQPKLPTAKEALTARARRRRASCFALADLGDANFETRPLLVLHMPLTRLHDEANCTEEPLGEDAQRMPMPWRSTRLIQGVFCMTPTFTQLLLRALVPRLVVGGHAHHVCGLRHTLRVRAVPILSRYTTVYSIVIINEPRTRTMLIRAVRSI